MAFTVGLLAFLAVDATLEALELAGELGRRLRRRRAALPRRRRSPTWPAGRGRPLPERPRASAAGGAKAGGAHLALMIAIGIGLHNLGEGLAIGSAYAIGELALGAFLVVGFAIHNTTEGFAIVAPLAEERPSLGRPARARGDRRSAGDPRRADRRHGLNAELSVLPARRRRRRDRPGDRPDRCPRCATAPGALLDAAHRARDRRRGRRSSISPACW